jgi:hypothetical protein
MTKDEHCKHAATLSGAEKITYMRENDITGEQVWRYGQTHKDTELTRAKKKKARVRVLVAQSGACALCETQIGVGRRSCLDRTGKVLCCQCNQFLTRYRKLRAGGVECLDMEEFAGSGETG